MRAWAMSESGAVRASVECEQGVSQLQACDCESVLLGQVSAWIAPGAAIQVVACGMVGARQGWVEIPYLSAPCAPLGELVSAPTTGDQLDVWICPGIKQSQPADVMRGEEAQIAGLLARHAEFDGVVCLPGTHSKWVRVCGGEVKSFRTFLTGELFSLLADQSVLRHSLAGDGWDSAAFLDAAQQMVSAPEMLTSKLFSIRAESLLGEETAAASRARLSGFLIGAELAATRSLWHEGAELALIGAGRLADLYVTALGAQGRVVTTYPGDELVVAGLSAAHSNLNRP